MLDTKQYRIAPSGCGEQAVIWKDKPHRLIYDLCGEVEELQVIVDKLPKTKDGVPVVPMLDHVYLPCNSSARPLRVKGNGYVSTSSGNGILFNRGRPVRVYDCYSTSAAAEADNSQTYVDSPPQLPNDPQPE